MSLSTGSRLAHYEILELVGRGGMGEVYRAKDSKLGRDVAIKVLPDEFAQDEERLRRFQREAKVLASLNHPNIAAIYGLEQSGGTRYLVLELVPGETLADRIARGPIPVEEALEIAKKIAEALEEAHERGIVHRDLKPANVKLTPDDKVKVLDFGLAKAFAEEGVEGDAATSMSPTITRDATRVGVILGTAAYMSPEQAKGRRVDKRSDVFSFGAVLYEILTGRKAFPGADVSETLAAVINTEPDGSRLPSHLDARLSRLMQRCVKKDPRERLRDMGDARIALAEVVAEPPATVRRSSQELVWAALVGAILTALVMWAFLDTPEPSKPSAPIRRTTITLPEGQAQPRIPVHPLALSPDGNLLAYVAEDDEGSGLFLRSLDGFETHKLPGTEGADVPFFSPDGEWLGFFAASHLKKISISHGSVMTIARAFDGLGASWGPDNTIVFAPSLNAGLFRVSADGGTLEQLTTPDFAEAGYAHVWPQYLPGGEAILFMIWGGTDEPDRAAVLDLDTRDWDVIRKNVEGASYVPTGHLVFFDNQLGVGLFAQPFEVGHLSFTGPAVQVLPDVRMYASQSGRPYMAFSPDGTVIYVAEASESSTVAWMDRLGARTPILSQPGSIGTPRLSPDGERVVFHDEHGNVKTLDLVRGTVDVVLSEAGALADVPIWDPRGNVTLTSNRTGSWNLHEVLTSERGAPELLLDRPRDQFPSAWSSDGKLLTFTEIHSVTGFDLWVLPVGGEPEPLHVSSSNEYQGVFSPDGRLLAYVSDESGRAEVYVQGYPQGETQVVSTSGGDAPAWSKDGSELFFRNGRQFLAVKITRQPRFGASAPRLLHEVRFDRAFHHVPDYYDVAPDGRFLVVEDRSTRQFNVIFGWFEELERLASSTN